MSIDYLGSLSNRFSEAGPQFTNLWEVYIDDWLEGGVYSLSQFDVLNTSLPLSIKLTSENYVHGKNYYSDVEFPSDFKLELREYSNFRTYNYFKKWLDSIFDTKRGVFISSPEKKTKSATLSFTSYKMNMDKYKILSKEFALEKMKNIQNIATQTLMQQTKKAAMENVPYPVSMITGQASSIASMKAQELFNRAYPTKFGDLFTEVTTKTFFIKNLRILGLTDLSLNYDTAEQLTIAADFVADRFIDSSDFETAIDNRNIEEPFDIRQLTQLRI